MPFTLPSSLKVIGDAAFLTCELTEIIIPEGVTAIEDSTFCNCFYLESVTIPQGVTKIGDSAFISCDALTEITIPDGVTKIGKKAFFSCDLLKSVVISDSVVFIGEEAFGENNNLTITYKGNTYTKDNTSDLYALFSRYPLYLQNYLPQAFCGCEKSMTAYRISRSPKLSLSFGELRLF